MNFPQLLIAISENFQKKGQPRYPDFRLFFPEVRFISILNFAPGISRIFGRMIRISEIPQLSEFLFRKFGAHYLVYTSCQYAI